MTATADAPDSSTVTELAQTIENLKETVEAQSKRIDELEETVDQQTERIEHLEAQPENELIEVKSEGDTSGLMDIWIADIPLGSILQKTTEDVDRAHNRLDEVETVTSNNGTPGVDANKTESQDVKTPLERVCALPEHIADRELTANQERARFIARDIQNYAEKAPAGHIIDSRAIKRVLTAAEGKRPHTQTVARVMDFLDELGKKEVQQKKRRGKKLIIVDPAAADCYGAHHDRCDRGDETSPNPA